MVTRRASPDRRQPAKLVFMHLLLLCSGCCRLWQHFHCSVTPPEQSSAKQRCKHPTSWFLASSRHAGRLTPGEFERPHAAMHDQTLPTHCCRLIGTGQGLLLSQLRLDHCAALLPSLPQEPHYAFTSVAAETFSLQRRRAWHWSVPRCPIARLCAAGAAGFGGYSLAQRSIEGRSSSAHHQTGFTLTSDLIFWTRSDKGFRMSNLVTNYLRFDMMKFGGLLASMAFASLLTACGGGGDAESVSNAPAPATTASAEGLWQGTTSTGRTVRTLVLDDGSYWSLYSAVNAPGIVSGVVQGTGSVLGGSFSSPSARDFNIEAATVSDATLSTSFTSKQSFNGAFNYLAPPTTVTFTSAYQAAYDQAPLLANLAGMYAGTSATGSGTETTTLTVSSTGAVVGTSSDGCQFAGTAAPRKKGNVFDVSLTFKGGSCANGTSTLPGVAYLDGTSLYSAVLNSTRSNGVLFTATKVVSTGSTGITGSTGSTGSVPTTAPPAVTVPATGSSSGSVITTGNSSGCGSRGGPGYRKANGQCASWADYYAGRR